MPPNVSLQQAWIQGLGVNVGTGVSDRSLFSSLVGLGSFVGLEVLVGRGVLVGFGIKVNTEAAVGLG